MYEQILSFSNTIFQAHGRQFYIFSFSLKMEWKTRSKKKAEP